MLKLPLSSICSVSGSLSFPEHGSLIAPYVGLGDEAGCICSGGMYEVGNDICGHRYGCKGLRS